MRVTLKSFGGISAGMTRPTLEVDATKGPTGSADTLKRLVEAAAAHSTAPPRAIPDEMSYALTVCDGDREHVLHQSDSTMTPQFAQLLDFVRLNGKAQPM